MEDDKAISVNLSLYKSQVNKVSKHVKNSKKFRDPSKFFQHLVDSFGGYGRSGTLAAEEGSRDHPGSRHLVVHHDHRHADGHAAGDERRLGADRFLAASAEWRPGSAK